MNATRLARILAYVGLGILACGLSALYVAAEQPAYRWDYGNYFQQFIEYGQKLTISPGGWFAAARYAIANLDYNPTSVLPLSPIYAAFGGSRTVYIAALIALYAIPATRVAATMAETAIGAGEEDKRRSLFIAALALLFWPLYIAALRGMPDVVGTIPLGIATILVLRTRYLSRASLWQTMVVGLLVWSAFLLRRWYAYSAVALVAATGAGCFTAIVVDRSGVRIAAITTLRRMAAVGLTIVAMVAIFQRPLALRVLHTSYADIYAPYQASLRDDLADFYGFSGPIICGLIAIGLLRAIWSRNHRILFCTLLAVLTFLLFTRVQGFGEQHILPIFFWLFPAFACGADSLCRLARRYRGAAATAVIACMLVGFLSEFSPPIHAAFRVLSSALPSTVTFPLRIENYPAYVNLIKTIRTSLRPGEKVAVIASSEDLSASFLQAIDPAIAQSVVAAADVDTRDGLRLSTFEAAYAVVTDPPALHLAPEFQRTISVPVADILQARGFGAAYERAAGPFVLSGGLQAFLYRRKRALSDADREQLIDEMRRFYPQWTMRSDGRLYVPEDSAGQRSR